MGSEQLGTLDDNPIKTVAGRALFEVYPSLLDSLKTWMGESKFKTPDRSVLPVGFTISHMPWGDQSHPSRIEIETGPAKGTYVLKERYLPSPVGQSYRHELAQTVQMEQNLRVELEELGVKLQQFLFASDDFCMVKFAEGNNYLNWRQVQQERIFRLHNLVFDYIRKRQSLNDKLWDNMHVHALDALKRPHLKDFVLEADGKSLVWVDPFVFCETDENYNFCKQRIEFLS